MTPPEKPEQGTDVDSKEDSAAPPWQRVAKDGANGAEDGHGNSGFGGSDGFAQDHDTDYYHTGELPVVTGTAANRLFGISDTGTQPAVGDTGGSGTSKGYDAVNVAGSGTRGRPITAGRRPGRGPRRASLQIKRFDPWSVLKLSLVLGVAMFFVWLIAVGLLYYVLDGMGVWDKLNGTYTSLVSGATDDSGSEPLISAGRVFGVAAIIGMINIVLLSALATVCAFIYNVSADLAGGLEVTLSERE